MKPVIGVTTFLSSKGQSALSSDYIHSIYAAGGIPVTIPIIPEERQYGEYLQLFDGLLFSGGDDIAPYHYGENPIREVQAISSIRDEYELALFRGAYERKLPIFGICRGIQLINVAMGGTLVQDINKQIPDTLGHFPREIATDELYHAVTLKEGSKVRAVFGKDKIFTNSFHHQCVKDIGHHLEATAFSEDGIIEAVESTEDRFLLGVQWHPECMTKRHPMFVDLFREFVQAAAAYQQTKQ